MQRHLPAWLTLLAAAALLGGCATTPQPPLTCAEGNAGRCRYEATQRLARGERSEAAQALAEELLQEERPGLRRCA